MKKILKVLINDELILEMDDHGNSDQEQVPAAVAALIHDWFVGSNPLTTKLIETQMLLDKANEKLKGLREYRESIREEMQTAVKASAAANSAINRAIRHTSNTRGV